MKWTAEFEAELRERLEELYDRAANATNDRVMLRFIIDHSGEIGRVHALTGPFEYRGNGIQITMRPGFRSSEADKRYWIEAMTQKIKRDMQG